MKAWEESLNEIQNFHPRYPRHTPNKMSWPQQLRKHANQGKVERVRCHMYDLNKHFWRTQPTSSGDAATESRLSQGWLTGGDRNSSPVFCALKPFFALHEFFWFLFFPNLITTAKMQNNSISLSFSRAKRALCGGYYNFFQPIKKIFVARPQAIPLDDQIPGMSAAGASIPLLVLGILPAPHGERARHMTAL
ncbi:hypothetical protein RRG08_020973 [Elysia crispata]|uniref:Uncharacterized protein n=1 Tax=Elysia crispata TaxID=231223 RepID=A0AAE1B8G4_9GAST|nr:hypothetical protein RRG08_020973 [Elysia crispata]